MKTLIVFTTFLAYAFAAPSYRITNGIDAEEGQFPYNVAIEWGMYGWWFYSCGGSIINENTIITTASCITGHLLVETFRIKAGLLHLDDTSDRMQMIDMSSYVTHEGFQGYVLFKIGVSPHDIAILKLSSNLVFNDYVQPISLPAPGVDSTGNAILSGWGSISTTPDDDMPNTLQTATVPIITIDECANALIELIGTSELLDPTNICTGPLDAGISICAGDSGSPLVQNGQLIGIASWGFRPCGRWPGAPSVYVQTSNYIDWIYANI